MVPPLPTRAGPTPNPSIGRNSLDESSIGPWPLGLLPVNLRLLANAAQTELAPFDLFPASYLEMPFSS